MVLSAVDAAEEMRFGEFGAGGTTSTKLLRSVVEYLGLCLPRMWSLRVSFLE